LVAVAVACALLPNCQSDLVWSALDIFDGLLLRIGVSTARTALAETLRAGFAKYIVPKNNSRAVAMQFDKLMLRILFHDF
jgi:hypothetical protein